MSDTKWTLGDWIGRGGMCAWHAADTAISGQTIDDASGNGRTLDTGFLSTPPDYQTNLINGLPGLYFDGSTHDPPKWSGSVTPKHIFIVAAAEGSAFDASYRGLLSGVSSGDVLTGNPSSANWFNFSLGHTYRRFDVAYTEAAAPAIFGTVGIMELTNTLGWPLNGIQIGQHRSFTDRRWKGWWCEHILYDKVVTDIERWKVYRYLAAKYHIWQHASAASTKAVFPFPADREYSREHARETYLSEPYDGDPSALIRGNFRSGYSLGFTLRRQEELDAAKAFYEAHHPLGEFAFRDYRYYPYRDTNVRFTSPLIERGSGVTYRFNYSFDVIED